MVKKIILFVAFIILIATLIGCGESKTSPDNINIKINLTGFPYGINSNYFSDFYAEIYVWENNTAQKIYKLGNIQTNTLYTQSISIGTNSTDISVYLFDPNFIEAGPCFFYQFLSSQELLNIQQLIG